MVLSSDGGMVDRPASLSLLGWGIEWLRDSGVPKATIDRMTRGNPTRILNLA
jgi:predicted metal-dependent phosphotriesterase family hydrolase